MTHKRNERPWESSLNTPAREIDVPDDTPYVEVPFSGETGARRFYSDRFYLNRTVYDEDVSGCNDSCPHLFDRSELLKNLDLQAAIIGTYTLDPVSSIHEHLVHEFPTLFEEDAMVPTLVLHGKRGWKYGDDDLEEESKGDDLPESDEYEWQDKQKPTVSNQLTEKSHVKSTNSEHETKAFTLDDEALLQQHEFPDSVHFTEIQSCWIRPENLPTEASNKSLINPEDGMSLHPDIVAKQQSCRGVHHPKFMLLFETSGSLVVIVSTANLTQQCTTDASWIQRFPPAAPRDDETIRADNDFGSVLTRFLYHQMLASRKQQMTTWAFCQEYMEWKSLLELSQRYDFEAAQVYLIPTIPGEYSNNRMNERKNKSSKGNKEPPKLLWGRQRVESILQQKQSLASSMDRLILQPTSFGADWTCSEMVHVCRSYMLGHAPDSPTDDRHFLERLDIVWPPQEAIHSWLNGVRKTIEEDDVKRSRYKRRSPSSVVVESTNGGVGGQPCVLFLSADTFNRIEMGCLSQMAIYETSGPPQRDPFLVPHIKTISRLLANNDNVRRCYGVAQDYLSWSMLTSACLSHGAQGKPVGDGGDDKLHYANFELGVLFVSRLEGKTTDRLYCFQPSKERCRNSSQLVHLPLPFQLRPAPYQDSEQMGFCKTPYMHEITNDAIVAGHMRFTPYGRAAIEQIHQAFD